MKKLFLSILFVMFMSISWAQTAISLKGKVVDSKSLKPLQNAVATITTSNVSVVSDRNGVFEFKDLADGSHTIELQTTGYVRQILRVETKKDQTTDLGTIVMEEDQASEIQLSLITITENDLGDDNSGSESTSGLLQASRDTYQQVAAFNWGQARYRIRGLDNEYGNTMINGVSMNKIYDGRPQWSNWGGLNDATRNQEFTSGSKASDYTFGSILGTQEINTRASHYRAGARVSFSGANTNYNWRTMGTYASGLNKNGWAFVVSGSGRIADEAHFEGTDYKSWGLFAAVEKKFNDKHSLNFTSIASYNSRGKNSPLTQEQIDLMGYEYNSYWGWQNGKKRNSRDKDVFEPINMLTHYWTMSNKTTLTTNVAYQTGHIANSRIDYQNAVNPDPVYYKNLPSYFLNQFDSSGNWTPDYAGAEQAANYFKNNPQLNWNSLYYANVNSRDGRSVYALYEDRTDDKVFSANSILASELSDNVSFNAAVNYKKLSSTNYQKLTDLLGGQYFIDTDMFYAGDAGQSDLNNPNRQVVEGDAYGYNYKLYADVIDAFTQFKVRYRKVDFYLSQQFSRSEYQREGLYRNGIYANNSFGKSKSQIFENFGFKGGVNYRITGNHILEANGIYQTKAPTLRNTFANTRLNNVITPDLESETIFGGDASYIIRTPKLKGRISGFYNKVTDATKIAFYYAESLGTEDSGDTDSFISEILTDIEKQNMGGELGLEYQITSTVKATFGAAYGEYTYSDNARVRYNDDAVAATGNPSITDLGKAYIKDYKQGGMPQQAYSFGLEYRAPQFWWIGANVNYLDDLYIDPSAILRTANFVTDKSTGVGYEGMTTEDVRKALKQEKLDSFTLVNVQGGKSWRVSNKNRNTVGFFASINNVFDVTYKTGGFEQSRKATYVDLKQDLTSGVRSFGPKYFHGYGRTYFVNVYFNF